MYNKDGRVFLLKSNKTKDIEKRLAFGCTSLCEG